MGCWQKSPLRRRSRDDDSGSTLIVFSLSKKCFQCNHLSHFLLTNLLREKLAEAGNARVINVSSIAAWHAKINLNNVNYESDSLEVELPQLEADERDVQPGVEQEVGKPWHHCLLKPSWTRQVEFNLTVHLSVLRNHLSSGLKPSGISPSQCRM